MSSFKNQGRNSRIELLKIIGIFLIVISHISQTLVSKSTLVPFSDYFIDASLATTNLTNLILAMSRYAGAFGNNIFFICSAWFLIDDDRVSGKKIIQMLLDVWIISVLILITTTKVIGYPTLEALGIKQIIFNLLPTTFANNWYITCYLIFYAFHPLLNTVIKNLSQEDLLKTTTALSVMYLGLVFIKTDILFPSQLIIWITVYLLIAYFKLYSKKVVSSVKINVYLVIVSLLLNIALICLTNYLGLHLSFLSNKLLKWDVNQNPLLIFASFGLLNLANNKQSQHKLINYISSLSLLIYVSHENLILRQYYRPQIWQYIYLNYGYEKVLLWTFLFSLSVFIISILISAIYQNTVQRATKRLSVIINHFIQVIWKKYEGIVIKK